jgi:[amino group carrier protein]-L-2-aminoadipate/L-glutamate 6-kinase
MYVIKVGGSLGEDLVNVGADVARLAGRGAPVVVLHGGSAETERLGRQLGVSSRYLTARDGMRSRYTDPATLDLLTLAMAGRVKPRLTAHLVQRGVRAVGLTGIDGALVTAKKTPPVKAMLDERLSVVRDDLTGRVVAVNTELLRLLLGSGYLPVLSPPVIDPEVGPLNIDGDRLAAAIAVALGATHLVILSNQPGLLRDLADPASLIPSLPQRDFAEYLGFAQGRMRVKLQAAREALEGGVRQVILGDGRLPCPIATALAGQGTRLEPDLVTAEVVA